VTRALLIVLLLAPGPAQARGGWRQLLDSLSRGSGGWIGRVAQQDRAGVSGYNRGRGGPIRVWRGPAALRTLVHELLHRVTAGRPEAYRRAMINLTSDLQVDEGLTSYFASRALNGRQTPATPQPGAPFRARRTWARDIRQAASAALRSSFGVEVDLSRVSILSDASFRRVYERDSERIWTRPTGQESYQASQRETVQALVDLVGEAPLRRAYFQGDVDGLKTALRQAREGMPRSQFPRWIDLR
jgi:hypothetical protein